MKRVSKVRLAFLLFFLGTSTSFQNCARVQFQKEFDPGSGTLTGAGNSNGDGSQGGGISDLTQPSPQPNQPLPSPGGTPSPSPTPVPVTPPAPQPNPDPVPAPPAPPIVDPIVTPPPAPAPIVAPNPPPIPIVAPPPTPPPPPAPAPAPEPLPPPPTPPPVVVPPPPPPDPLGYLQGGDVVVNFKIRLSHAGRITLRYEGGRVRLDQQMGMSPNGINTCYLQNPGDVCQPKIVYAETGGASYARDIVLNRFNNGINGPDFYIQLNTAQSGWATTAVLNGDYSITFYYYQSGVSAAMTRTTFEGYKAYGRGTLGPAERQNLPDGRNFYAQESVLDGI